MDEKGGEFWIFSIVSSPDVGRWETNIVVINLIEEERRNKDV